MYTELKLSARYKEMLSNMWAIQFHLPSQSQNPKGADQSSSPKKSHSQDVFWSEAATCSSAAMSQKPEQEGDDASGLVKRPPPGRMSWQAFRMRYPEGGSVGPLSAGQVSKAQQRLSTFLTHFGAAVHESRIPLLLSKFFRRQRQEEVLWHHFSSWIGLYWCSSRLALSLFRGRTNSPRKSSSLAKLEEN